MPINLITLRRQCFNGGNASAAFSTSLLRASASLFSHFFKVTSSYGGEDPEAAVPLPKRPVIASVIDALVIKRTGSTDIVIPCS